ncbi:HAMP domain-containing sensor histidine kinase [Dactylosporangium sp. AC04546]|uniref:sensor histidine kinase n=1 Tax=Dactylosporangium sp. AC04546 TaxID=2862460 RepID=UPI001EDE4A82|nr:HAMP domain-containing sensor histidine kinase [Dactylosporangium sp. AC04546]WVK83677.1 HAMP domain-containing sensor histidine kinase [Dactylosporangium sp. AC04546]
MKALPLRIKLVGLMLVLLALALVMTSAVGVYNTQHYLSDRLDEQLKNNADRAAELCNDPGRQFMRGPKLPQGYYVGCVDIPTGAITPRDFQQGYSATSDPKVPDNAVDLIGGTEISGPFYTTVPSSKAGGPDWRILVTVVQSPGPSHDPTVVVVGFSLDEVDKTVNQQIWVSVTVGAGVLLLLAVVAYLLVRSSLRPLVEVEETAEAIAAGDLTRRVPYADPRTEVGGLSTALNTMLGQIETAFDERRASEEAALASEERMRRFVADASHELRTPLTSIRGFAELHRQSGHGDETIGRIEHHATRMGLLVDDLLLLARMDQQRPLEKKPVDLLTLATDAMIDARVTATDHRLRLRTASSDDDDADVEPALVVGDEARLRQVLQNLLSNALHHTPPGTEVTVFVGTEPGKAVLEVSDNGPGMAPEDAARVFERFYRTDPSRTRALGGSGLGLSIVAALVHAHGGEVTLRTAPGEGATFRVTLPLARP